MTYSYCVCINSWSRKEKSAKTAIKRLGDLTKGHCQLFINSNILRQSFKKLASISSDRKWNSTHPSDGAEVSSWLIRFRPKIDSTALVIASRMPASTSLTNGWMRVAVRDQGACLMLDRIRVYYLTCPAWQVSEEPSSCAKIWI